MLNLPVEETEDLLESLVDTSLVESAAPGRYRYHDLVRLYARACAERDESPPSETAAAVSRLLDFYLATVSGVYLIERPGDRLVDHLEHTEHPGLVFSDRHTAQDWLYAEAVSLLACVRQAARPETLRRAVDTLWAACDLAESGTNSKEYEAVVERLREVAQEAGDSRSEARTFMALAFVHHVSGSRFDAAVQEGERAIELAEAEGDALTSCWSSNISGAVAMYQSRLADAEQHFTRALESFRVVGDRTGEASALCNLSRTHLATGRTESAVALARQGTALYDDMEHDLRGANGRYALGLALTRSGKLAEATECLQEALRVFRDRSAAPVGGHDRLPTRRTRPHGTASRAGGGERRDGADAAARCRRRLAAGQRPHGARPRPHRHRPAGPGTGLLAGGAGHLRDAGRSGGAGGQGLADAVGGGLTAPWHGLWRCIVHRSFIAARQSRTCRAVASGGRRNDTVPGL